MAYLDIETKMRSYDPDPEAGTSLRINDYAIDVLQTGENAVKTVRLIADRA